MRSIKTMDCVTTGNDAVRAKCVTISTGRITTSKRWPWVLSLPVLGGLLMMVALALPAVAEPRVILKGHTLALGGLAYSADGMYVATASYDRTAKVWEAATGRLVRTIEVPTSRISSVAFSPDSRRLAIGGHEPTTVWELGDTNREPVTLQGQIIVRSVAFSPDGLRIIAGSRNAKVWEAATGRELLTLRGHTKFISSVAISADGQRIITGSWDQTVGIWEAATTNQVAAWEAEERAAATQLRGQTASAKRH